MGDGLLVNDAFPAWSGAMEPFTTLAGLSGRLPTASLGFLPRCAARDVVWTAKQAATLDQLSAGRFLLAGHAGVLGAGVRVRRRRSDPPGACSPARSPSYERCSLVTRPIGWRRYRIRRAVRLSGSPAAGRHVPARTRRGTAVPSVTIGPTDVAALIHRWHDEGGGLFGVRIRMSVAAAVPSDTGVEWNALVGPPSFLAEQLAAYQTSAWMTCRSSPARTTSRHCAPWSRSPRRAVALRRRCGSAEDRLGPRQRWPTDATSYAGTASWWAPMRAATAAWCAGRGSGSATSSTTWSGTRRAAAAAPPPTSVARTRATRSSSTPHRLRSSERVATPYAAITRTWSRSRSSCTTSGAQTRSGPDTRAVAPARTTATLRSRSLDGMAHKSDRSATRPAQVSTPSPRPATITGKGASGTSSRRPLDGSSTPSAATERIRFAERLDAYRRVTPRHVGRAAELGTAGADADEHSITGDLLERGQRGDGVNGWRRYGLVTTGRAPTSMWRVPRRPAAATCRATRRRRRSRATRLRRPGPPPPARRCR